MASYKTIYTVSTGKYTEKGSRFIASAFHVQTETEANDFIEAIRKEHHKARHVCYAYSIGITNPKFKVNDDGEPVNTAGQPILNQIKKYGLNYIVIVVVRYFGGVLLGKGGLVNAYGTAASEALNVAEFIEKKELDIELLAFHIRYYVEIMELIKRHKLIILSEDYDGEICKIKYLTEPEKTTLNKAIFKSFQELI